MRRVIVHIDSLVLKGYRHEERYAIADGVRGELNRLLAHPTTVERLASLGDMPSIRVGKINLAQDAKPEHFGVSAASAIVRGLSR